MSRSSINARSWAGIGLLAAVSCTGAQAATLTVANPGFELDAPNSNEFFFGAPAGWQVIDPNNLLALAGNVTGTLDTVLSPDYFNPGEATGDVAIIFIGDSQGGGEVGLRQSLADSLAANTRYTLSVDVGNIRSGTTVNGTFFNLEGFPGYRIELVAGDQVIAQTSDDDTAPIGEGEFDTVVLEHVTGASPAQLGETLEIRLFSLNIGTPGATSPDSEVDFDNVVLDASPVPLPASLGLFAAALGWLGWHRRRST